MGQVEQDDLTSELRWVRTEFTELLFLQTRMIDALLHQISAQPNLDETSDERAFVLGTITLMIQSLGVSIHSALRLTDEVSMAIRDAFGIARSAAELELQHCLHCGRRNRHSETGSATCHAEDLSGFRAGRVYRCNCHQGRDKRPSLDQLPPEVREAVIAFTDRRGREVRDWTKDNIDKRIALVAERHPNAATSLSGAVFATYRHASELLHGTYFGVLHFWTGSKLLRASTKTQFARIWLGEHFVTRLHGSLLRCPRCDRDSV